MFSPSDRHCMEMALDLAKVAKGTTFPNPSVGAVVQNEDGIIGSGATSHYGGPHAEINALEQAGLRAKGSTLFVTLEPCNHFGKTPPCTEAIISAGISRVVIAAVDPNPLVAGSGIDHLKKCGIAVECGLLEKEAIRVNEDFFWSIIHKKPWITLKLAMTLDGMIADINSYSKWISNENARIFVHELRKNHAAVAIGATTYQKDNPRLSVRYVQGKSPDRIVFKTGEIDFSSFGKKDASSVPTRSIFVSRGGNSIQKEQIDSAIEHWHTGTDDPDTSLLRFMDMAYQDGLTSILVEGGSAISSSFLERGLVNRLYIFYGGSILGGGLPGIHFKQPLPLSLAIKLQEIEYRSFEDTFMVTGLLQRG